MMNTMHTSTTPPQHMDDHLEPRQPAQLPVGITKNSPTNGGLIGNPPTPFDGDRSKTDQFMTQFGMFRMINNTHAVITNPMQRVTLALTYIRGPKVNKWVSQQFNALSTKVYGDANHAPTHADTDEALWEDFITEFERAYNETVEEAFARLEALQMTGDDVETYIATFENLMRQSRYEREDGLMVEFFWQGLTTNFKQHITKRETIPDTMDEWQSAARNELKRRRRMKTLKRGRKGDTDTVQTGVIRLSTLSEEERARRMTEGRGFKCNGKGHQARDCPDTTEGENV
jgi:hypothetical protein